ncbi:MAG TPA: acyloxyacyl hydrolase [Edaphobacter sp.]|uniref:acyloxyacyl hydrolase n=1 Tax=Edaphobacter sp. TaxID=1934404 RepID=UPI002D08CC54|nr:acyloxyacyl hydrolase [Edaphobacter sp.]HUZ96315.1 acyloxyacyl hydrolase [Edaphobacter sp.]
MTKGFRGIARPLIAAFALVFSVHLAIAQATATNSDANPFHANSGKLPLELGVLVQSGVGLTEDRNSFKFLMAGVHAGKVLTGDYLPGPLHGNFEYAVEVFPFWQSYTPKFQRANCGTAPNSPDLSCSPLYTVGGTYTGVSITPIILRWNFTGTRRISPWIQGAGGVLWTNHKYPAFGGGPLSVFNDGPNTDASVWNFTPQGGVGLHYFFQPRRSIDFSANAVHISSASLGDKNPGVNASLQFTIGYTWWK